MKLLKILSTGIFALTAACMVALPERASADLIRDDRTFEEYEDYALSKPEFESVGYIAFNNYQGTRKNTSCFYIGDGLVLTTGHSLRSTSTSPFFTNFVVGFGNNIFTDPGLHFPFIVKPGQNTFIHPDFVQWGVKGDLAILYIPELRNAGIPVAQISPTRIPTYGVFDLVSYGAPGVVDQFINPQDGQLRGGTNSANRILTDFFEARFHASNFGYPLSTDLEVGGLDGASGSPAWYNGEVVGIANYQLGAPAMFSVTGYEYIDVHIPWIDSIRERVRPCITRGTSTGVRYCAVKRHLKHSVAPTPCLISGC
jgi:hypothetical protein